MSITLESAREIESLRHAGTIVANALQELRNSAQFEHTLAITERGPEILTLSSAGEGGGYLFAGQRLYNSSECRAVCLRGPGCGLFLRDCRRMGHVESTKV